MKHARRPSPGIDIRGPRRRGAIAVLAMIGLLVAGMISTTLVRLAVTRHRQVEHEALRLQSEWLAEAGLERAAARLAAASAPAEYGGETWPVAAANLGRGQAGRVTITVEPARDGSQYRVTAVADYPADGSRRARARRSAAVTAPSR
ncbi:MAG TPA: hypothetical protein VML55_18160 [Planctomycetaceae bacterium]|nr:hypothetical protein [Planctomycetaceae bacterium]